VVNDILADGTIRFRTLCDLRNDSPTPVRELRFCNSDFVHVERMSSVGRGTIPFEVLHQNRTFEYKLPLSEDLPPGQALFLRTEGAVTNLVRRLDDGGFEFSEQHWPANDAATLRVETYCLPAGAEVIETAPADMTQRRLFNGRVELHTQKIIPPGSHIAVHIRYRLPR